MDSLVELGKFHLLINSIYQGIMFGDRRLRASSVLWNPEHIGMVGNGMRSLLRHRRLGLVSCFCLIVRRKYEVEKVLITARGPDVRSEQEDWILIVIPSLEIFVAISQL